MPMTHWQLGHHQQARALFEAAVQWMDENAPYSEDLLAFRAEAAELLGHNDAHVELVLPPQVVAAE